MKWKLWNKGVCEVCGKRGNVVQDRDAYCMLCSECHRQTKTGDPYVQDRFSPNLAYGLDDDDEINEGGVYEEGD